MKKLIATLALPAALAVAPASHASGILVFDLQQSLDMAAQIKEIQAQLEVQKRSFESMNGATDIGRQVRYTVSSVRQHLPDDWNDAYPEDGTLAVGNEANVLQDRYEQEVLSRKRGDAVAYTTEKRELKAAQDRVMVQRSYDAQKQELDDIEYLTGQIDESTSPKEINALQARISVAQSTSAARLSKLQMMGMLQRSEDQLIAQQEDAALKRYTIGTAEDSYAMPSFSRYAK